MIGTAVIHSLCTLGNVVANASHRRPDSRTWPFQRTFALVSDLQIFGENFVEVGGLTCAARRLGSCPLTDSFEGRSRTRAADNLIHQVQPDRTLANSAVEAACRWLASGSFRAVLVRAESALVTVGLRLGVARCSPA
jgi:hypothetical protein